MMPKSYNPKETEELLLSDVKKKGQFKMDMPYLWPIFVVLAIVLFALQLSFMKIAGILGLYWVIVLGIKKVRNKKQKKAQPEESDADALNMRDSR